MWCQSLVVPAFALGHFASVSFAVLPMAVGRRNKPAYHFSESNITPVNHRDYIFGPSCLNETFSAPPLLSKALTALFATSSPHSCTK